MTADELRGLIAKGETLDVEFKGEERGTVNDNELVEAVVCLANRSGGDSGWLLIGVEDDGRVTGARPRHEAGRTDPARVQALIAGRTRPAQALRAELISVGASEVLVIEVPAARSPVGTTDGKYLRRAIGGDGRPACVPFHFHEMQAHQADRGILDYSVLSVSGVGWADLDPLEFERYRRRIRESQGRGDGSLLELSDLELAKALGVVEANGAIKHVRVAGLLLFGREGAIARHLPAHEVAFQMLSGTEVKVNDFFRWPLLRVTEEIETRFRVRNQETELMVGMARVGVPDYPERAFREGVANALIHRDYARLGAVHVQWHDDRIEISNPGGFPEGVRLDNLLVTSPRPRNPLLADAFKRAGVVERTARGIDTMFQDCLHNGLPAPDYSRSGATDVVVILRGARPDLDWVRLVIEEGRKGGELRLDDLLVLRLAADSPEMDLSRVCAVTQSDAKAATAVIARLADRGLIGKQSRSNTFTLSAAARRRLRLPQPDLRRVRRGLGDLEQAILRIIDVHGRVTRGQISAQQRLGTDQAKRVLAAMVARGFLVRRGEGRGAYYESARKKRAVARSIGRPPVSARKSPKKRKRHPGPGKKHR